MNTHFSILNFHFSILSLSRCCAVLYALCVIFFSHRFPFRKGRTMGKRSNNERINDDATTFAERVAEGARPGCPGCVISVWCVVRGGCRPESGRRPRRACGVCSVILQNMNAISLLVAYADVTVWILFVWLESGFLFSFLWMGFGKFFCKNITILYNKDLKSTLWN